MYLEHFGLSAPPFQFTASPMALFMSRTHREAMSALEWGLLHEPTGLTLLIGESGTGKTTLMCALLARQYRDLRAAYLGNPKLSFEELLGSILSQLGIRGGRSSKGAMLNAFAHFAADLPLNERIAILVDEAQLLSNDALEDFRLLSNMERHGRKAAQIVLAGQYELARRLSAPAMRHFNERIGARAVLLALTTLECRDYIEHRLRLCRSTTEKIFAPRALDHIVRYSSGIPRRINALCHNSLLLAYSNGAKRVTLAMAKEVAADYAVLEGTPKNLGLLTWLLDRARQGARSLRPVVGLALLGAAGFICGQMLMRHHGVRHLGSWAMHAAGTSETIAMPVADIRTKDDVGAKTENSAARAAAVPRTAESVDTLDNLRPATPERGSESSDPNPANTSPPAAREKASAPSTAPQAPVPKSDASRRYVVVGRGDTLGYIALRHLGSVNAWPNLLRLNPHIGDASRLYPGEIVYLPQSSETSSNDKVNDSDVE